MTMWHPRGTPTWPNWTKAEPGTRVRNHRTGHEGTFVKVGNAGHKNAYAVVDWDPRRPGWKPSRGRVVAPAFDLEVIHPDGTT